MICNIGGNWDIDVLFDHHMDYHNLEILPLIPTLEQFLEAEQNHINDPYIESDSSNNSGSESKIKLKTTYSSDDSSDNYSSDNKQKTQKVKKSSTDYSSDNSISGSKQEKKKVKKSAAKRNAAVNDEKLKQVQDELNNSIKQVKLNNDQKLSSTILTLFFINDKKQG